MRFGRYSHWAVPLIAGALGACAGNGEGLDQNGQPIGTPAGMTAPGGTPSGTVMADFQSIQDNVFTPICSQCHIGASAPEGLQLDAAHSYNLLVGVPSTEQPNLLRIDPSNPDASYLLLKIEGTADIVGGQMPLGEAPLPQPTIDAIRQWIVNGALNAQSSQSRSAVAAPPAFGIQTTAPLDGATVPAPLGRIVVTFTQDVDASLVNSTTVSLERLADAEPAADGTAAGGASQPSISIAPAAKNQAALLLTPQAALEAGSYRVTLRGTGAAALADADGSILGVDYSFVFSVEPAK
jgi:hypothetical protein